MADDSDFDTPSINSDILKRLFGSGRSSAPPLSGGLSQQQKPATPTDFSKLFPPYQPPESSLQLAQGIGEKAKAMAPQLNPMSPNRIRSMPIGGLAVGSQQPSTISSNNLPQILQALRR